MRYHRQIRETEAEIARLGARVHETYRGTDRDAWHQATADFHAYISPIDGLIDRTYSEDFAKNPELVSFAIDFLECDLLFFRSGYVKEHLLEKLKAVSFTEAETDRLREVLVDAVVQRGRREFRRYCKLAAVLEDSDLIDRLEELARSTDEAVCSRARLMISYMNGNVSDV